jgi:hypothetical protein
LLEFVAPLVARGLRPLEARDKGRKLMQGWTWRMDCSLTTGNSAVPVDGNYSKGFMIQITCPVLAVMATNGLLRQTEGDSLFLKRNGKRKDRAYGIKKN